MSAAVRKLEVNGWDVILANDSDEEPRVRDVDLAERAGLARPRKVREVIARNRSELEAHGPLPMRPYKGRIEKRGAFASTFEEREVSEYWLNEAQALALVVLLRTAQAKELRIQLVKLFVAVRRSLAPVPAPAPIAFADVHGSRIGETHVRAEVASWCRVAAHVVGVSVHRVHGALRRQYRVCSVYDLAVAVWPTARTFLESLAHGKLRLDPPNKKPVLRLLQGGKAQAQTSFPWGEA